jgi:ABC-type glycerol-3-phosphate transport system substrate-binding protein
LDGAANWLFRWPAPLLVRCSGNEGRRRNEEEGIDAPPVRSSVSGCVRDHVGGAVRAHRARGRQAVGRVWDHWVPGANDASRALVEEWAAKEKVDVQIDYITSQGEKLRLTIAAESQARSGHDILLTGSWWPHAYANQLEPVDDLVGDLIKLNGTIDDVAALMLKACAQHGPRANQVVTLQASRACPWPRG